MIWVTLTQASEASKTHRLGGLIQAKQGGLGMAEYIDTLVAGNIANFAHILIVILGSLFGIGHGASEAQREFEYPVVPGSELIGQRAPEIEGRFAINGEPVSLSQLKGKVALLDFWAVWCPPCVTTFPKLTEWHEQFKDDGLVILGVTTYYQRFDFDKETGKLKLVKDFKVEHDATTGEAHIRGGLSEKSEQQMLANFAEFHNLNHLLIPLSKEQWQKASRDYYVRGIPTFVLIDRNGVVRMIRVGSGDPNTQALEMEIRNLLNQK